MTGRVRTWTEPACFNAPLVFYYTAVRPIQMNLCRRSASLVTGAHGGGRGFAADNSPQRLTRICVHVVSLAPFGQQVNMHVRKKESKKENLKDETRAPSAGSLFPRTAKRTSMSPQVIASGLCLFSPDEIGSRFPMLS